MIKDFNVIIAGGRDFKDFSLLERRCNKLLSMRKESIKICCGMARGADKLGSVYAKRKGHGVMNFPANWDKHGKAAGIIRNKQMGDYADALIAFWDGSSRGTKHMIDYATQLGLKVAIIKY